MASFPKEISITVCPVLRIPDETAELCVRFLELWLNDNPHKTLIAEKTMEEAEIRTRLQIRQCGVKEDNNAEKR